MHYPIVFSSLFMMKFENFSSAGTLEVGWKRRHTIDRWRASLLKPPTSSTYFSPRHSILGKMHPQMPRPHKDNNRFEAIFITTAPKIKNSKSTFTTFYIDPLVLPISYDTLCMCSLTAVYINQYIYQTAAAYCVCRFE